MQQFLNIFTEVLRKHAGMKNKYIRASQSVIMNKNYREAKMKRSRLSKQ